MRRWLWVAERSIGITMLLLFDLLQAAWRWLHARLQTLWTNATVRGSTT